MVGRPGIATAWSTQIGTGNRNRYPRSTLDGNNRGKAILLEILEDTYATDGDRTANKRGFWKTQESVRLQK